MVMTELIKTTEEIGKLSHSEKEEYIEELKQGIEEIQDEIEYVYMLIEETEVYG